MAPVLLLLLVVLVHTTHGTDCPTGCSCLSTIVSCKNINHIPPGLPLNTSVLELKYNNLTSIPYGSITYLTDLAELDVQYNLLDDKGFTQESVYGLNNILRVTANHNQFLQLPTFFPGVLNFLDMDNNHIQTLPDLSCYPNLQQLYLSNNLIYQISADAFKNNKEIVEINLQNNQIHQVEEGAFAGLQKLKFLDLSENELTTEALSHNEFWGLWSMYNLSLAGNPITKVPQLPSTVKALNLERTNIREIKKGDFGGFIAIDSLQLGGGPLSIAPEGLSELGKLELLYVENAELQPPQLSADLFRGLRNLSSLVFINASLSGIAPDALSKTPQLMLLDLNRNQISRLQPAVFDPLVGSYPVQIFLSENPWWCDCNLRWLKELTELTLNRRTHLIIRDTEDMICSGPPDVKNKAFPALDVTDFKCK